MKLIFIFKDTFSRKPTKKTMIILDTRSNIMKVKSLRNKAFGKLKYVMQYIFLCSKIGRFTRSSTLNVLSRACCPPPTDGEPFPPYNKRLLLWRCKTWLFFSATERFFLIPSKVHKIFLLASFFPILPCLAVGTDITNQNPFQTQSRCSMQSLLLLVYLS